jgi:hypothetical protein
MEGQEFISVLSSFSMWSAWVAKRALRMESKFPSLSNRKDSYTMIWPPSPHQVDEVRILKRLQLLVAPEDGQIHPRRQLHDVPGQAPSHLAAAAAAAAAAVSVSANLPALM